jgi:HlyD family secretion protein
VNMLKRHWLIAGLVVVVIAVFAAFEFKGNDKPQYFTTKVEHGDIHEVVEATGTINAVTTVQVGSQVSGTISHLYADFNSRVKKGQVVAQIDPSLFQGALLQAKADFANAKANLVASQANLEKAKATALQTRADYERTSGLAQQGVMSQQQLDLAKANADTADAAVAAAQAAITQAAAQVQQKQAAVTVAQTNLDYTTIHAPIDGTVIARSVDVGQTVAASLQAPTLFTIAQDLTKMQVYASTDESDVGMIRTDRSSHSKSTPFLKTPSLAGYHRSA